MTRKEDSDRRFQSFGIKSDPSRRARTALPVANSNFEDYERKPSKRELVGSVSDLKKKRPKTEEIVIPAQPNTLQFSSKLEEKAYNELLNQGAKRVVPVSEIKIESAVKTENGDTYVSGLQTEAAIGEDADYSQVPIESFGMGMLRGMGWQEGGGIGKTFKSVTQTKILEKRPAGLGLGATPGSIKDQALVAIGDRVKITEGKNRGVKGAVVDQDVANVRITIQDKRGRKYDVSELCVEKISRHDNQDETKSSKKSKDKRYKNDGFSVGTAPERKGQTAFKLYESQTPPWLLPDIRVRVIDESSRYFKEKYAIKNVITPYMGMLENGKEFHQSQMETVIPKKEVTRCTVVHGPYRGCIGRINTKRKKQQKLVLEFWDDDNGLKIEEFSYWHICESSV